MSEAQATTTSLAGQAKTKSPKRFERFYRLFRPSSSDVRRQERDENEKTKKIITGLTKVKAPEKERFIPVASQSLLKTLTQEDMWAPGENELGAQFMQVLNAWRHQSYRDRLTLLKDSYLNFSPDSDTLIAEKFSKLQKRELRHDFMENIGDLLESANYEKINQANLDLLLSSDSPYGLRLEVDLDAFDDVVIYFRGAGTKIVKYRDWKWLYLKKKPVDMPIFQRLLIALKLKATDEQVSELMVKEDLSRQQAEKRVAKNLKLLPDGVTSDLIYLKLFKNIPQDDLEMMFPNTKVAFKLLDKLKIGLTAGGGTVAGLASAIPKVLLVTTAAALNPIVLLTTLAGIIGLLVRQVTKIFHQRNEYMMTLAQNLYFHNLANNRGVLTLLVDRAEEEDIKEEILLYTFLCRHQDKETNLITAKEEIETFLKTKFDVDIEFDLEDAFSRLVRDGLVEKNGVGYKILPPRQAINQIHRLWRGVLEPSQTA